MPSQDCTTGIDSDARVGFSMGETLSDKNFSSDAPMSLDVVNPKTPP